jgi:CRISPR-associated protein Csm4
MYSTYRITLTPLTAFATPMLGDTLFGQLCWALREEQGESALKDALVDYTKGNPFAVVSDALPVNYLPRPLLPPHYLGSATDSTERKQWKKIRWIPESVLHESLNKWLEHSLNQQPENVYQQAHPHNSINRLTGTTGKEGFAPYAVEEFWYAPGYQLQIYVVIDAARLEPELLKTLFVRIGSFGFGRDASIGLGKFSVDDCQLVTLPLQQEANAWLTLAPCAPQGMSYDAKHSYWQPFTRYGRHGNIAVFTNPFKNPVLLATGGSVFAGKNLSAPLFVGQGLGGNSEVSKTIPETVQQGYAPVIGIHLHDVIGDSL